MEPAKKYDCDKKLNILGSEIGENPDAFDEDAWMELFEASMLAAEQLQESMSEEEQEAFTAKNLAGFERVMEKAAVEDAKFAELSARGALDTEKYDNEEETLIPVKMEIKSAGMTVEEILEKSSEIEADLARELDIVDITESGKEKWKPRASWKRRRKMLLMAAAVTVLGLGTTMVTQGNRQYELKRYPMQAERNVIANHNSALRMDQSGDLTEAYRQIEETLGITVYALGDLPASMLFEALVLDEDYAAIKFRVNKKTVYFEQRKVSNIKEISDVVISDRKKCTNAYNEWLNREFVIESNILDNGLTEYSAGFIENDVLYYLSGITDEEVFISLVKDIHKFNN